MFDDSQINALEEVFRSSGLKYFKGGKYVLDSSSTTSQKTFLKAINFPTCMKGVEALKNVYVMALEGTFPLGEIGTVLERFKYEPKTIPGIGSLEEAYTEALGESSDGASMLVDRLVPVVNMVAKGEDRVMLLDPEDNYTHVPWVDVEVYATRTGRKIPDIIANPSVPMVVPKFDPYQLKSLFKDRVEGTLTEIVHLNLYVAPRWRFLKTRARYHGFIKDLIDHLFPVEEEREQVLDWLHHVLIRRAESILCLVGARGTGKGLLLNDILSAVIGFKHREIVNQSILTDKFNAAFKNKRYTFFDEVDISGQQELSKFRAFANNTIVVERKRFDSETINNYASMALTSNERKHIKILPQERRFSIPEVTEIPFTTIRNLKEIEDFCNRIKEPESEEIAEFGKFLLEREPKTAAQHCIKGKYYFELSYLSMEEWRAFLIDYIIENGVEGQIIPNIDIAKEFKQAIGKEFKWPSKRATVSDFLWDYKHEAKYKIGGVEDWYDNHRSRNSFGIMPNPEFLQKFGKAKEKAPKFDIKAYEAQRKADKAGLKATLDEGDEEELGGL